MILFAVLKKTLLSEAGVIGYNLGLSASTRREVYAQIYNLVQHLEFRKYRSLPQVFRTNIQQKIMYSPQRIFRTGCQRKLYYGW